MADREKVYGFELCANGEPCIGEKFMKCPFSPRNNAEQNCGVTMAKTAIALLQEQEYKLDSIVCFENGDKVRLWNCPLCKSEVRIVLKGR